MCFPSSIYWRPISFTYDGIRYFTQSKCSQSGTHTKASPSRAQSSQNTQKTRGRSQGGGNTSPEEDRFDHH